MANIHLNLGGGYFVIDRPEDLQDIIDTYKMQGYKLRAVSWKRGYLTRKKAGRYTSNYHGKYGDGITVEKPAFQTTQYHIIEYYTK